MLDQRGQLVRADAGFAARSMPCTTGMAHSPVSATGTAGEPTPWRATQRAVWETVRRVEGLGT